MKKFNNNIKTLVKRINTINFRSLIFNLRHILICFTRPYYTKTFYPSLLLHSSAMNYYFRFNSNLLLANVSASTRNKSKRFFTSERDVKPVIFKDYSNSNLSGLYKIYDKVYLNDMFNYNIAEILEDLYDNNEFVIFKLYFIRKPRGLFTMDEVKLYNHLDNYHMEFILENLTMFHKNMGLIGCMYVPVWTSNYDFNNLKVIASNMRKDLLSNIVDINLKINEDYGNTIVNFKNEMESLNELYLFIGVDRSNHQMLSEYN